jgi:hypothetical protein
LAEAAAFLGDLVTAVSAVVGGVGFVIGLILCTIAFRDARKTAADSRAKDPATGVERLGIPADVVKVLPELIKTSAGIAVAVLLLSTALLIGVTVSDGGGNSDASDAAQGDSAS